MKRFLVVVIALIMVASVFSTGFQDVKQDHWAYDYVYNLTSRGIIPVDETHFRGSDPLTRSYAAIWMNNLVMYLENSPMIARTPDVDRLKSRVSELEKQLGAQFEDYETFKARITRHHLMLKYDAYDKIDALDDKIFYIQEDVAQIDDILDRLTSAENEIIQLKEASRAAYTARNLANALADDFLILVGDVDDAIATLNEVEEIVYERGYLLDDMNRAINRINTFNDNQSRAISRLARRSADNEKAINELEEELMEKINAANRQTTINKNTIDAIIEDMFLMVDDHDQLSAEVNSIDERLTEMEAKEIPEEPNLVPLYILSILGIGLGIAGIFLP